MYPELQEMLTEQVEKGREVMFFAYKGNHYCQIRSENGNAKWEGKGETARQAMIAAWEWMRKDARSER